MGPLFAAAVTCWCCTLLATPRKMRWGNEIEELVYTRLLGRHHRLALLALGVTAVTFFTLVATLACHADDASAFVPQQQRVCYDGSAVLLTCYTPQPTGMWVRDELQPDGTWQRVGMITTLPARSG